MRARKDWRVPTPEELPSIFDDKFIGGLAQTARLPPTAEIPRFAAAVRDAARLYIRDASVASINEVHHEVDRLLRAADRAVHARKRKDAACEIVAARVERLSERTRELISEWGGTLPDPEVLRNPATQHAACETIASLCRIGAGWREGRRRSGGRRSMTMVSVLHAPPPQQHPARREAQLNFVTWLQVAYLEAAGRPPPATTHPDRPSPFAQMVQVCLDKLEAEGSAVEMINELRRKSKQTRQRLSRQKP
jgi:hypothetical protein